jgi:hypothetical protein
MDTWPEIEKPLLEGTIVALEDTPFAFEDYLLHKRSNKKCVKRVYF